MHAEFTRRNALSLLALTGLGLGSNVRRVRGAGTPARGGKPPIPTDELLGPGAFDGRALALPGLPYSGAGLEPVIDAQTMEIHHDRHHRAYVENGNKALLGTPLEGRDPLEIIADLAGAPGDRRTAIRNNVGGHVNHSMFWRVMAPPGAGGGGRPEGSLARAIDAAFGSFDGAGGFQERFAEAANGRFGSGWAWLCADGGGLSICSTANQDNPMMGEAIASCAGVPVLGLDVWEHAYYLKHRNRRADYVSGWWRVVDWKRVGAWYETATGG